MHMKLLKASIAISLSLGLINCTQKNEPAELKMGAYAYKILPAKENKDIVAKVNDREVTRRQMLINAPSIKELKKRMSYYHLAFIYRMARESKAEEKTIIYHLPTPEVGLEKLLKSLQFEVDDSITYDFKESESKAVATVNGKELMFKDIPLNNLKYQELKSQIFKESINALNKVTTKLLLFDAAKAQNINTQDYIAKEIPQEKTTLSDKELQAYIEKNNLKYETDNNENLLKRVKDIALQKKRNAYLENIVAEKLLKKPVEVYLQEPDYSLNIKTDTAASIGNKKSKVKVFLFTQYNCQACGNLQKDILNESFITDKVHLMSMYNFSERDRDQVLVAEASFCALKQNKYWEFSNMFFNENLQLTENNINQTVEKVGLNKEEFKNCFLARETQETQEYQVKYSQYLGLNSSPTLVIDGEVFSGPTDLQVIKDTVRRKLHARGEVGIIDRILAFFS